MTLRLMTLRCDHCREQLGHDTHCYWHMRFCSAACMQAYKHRLDDETQLKIHHLDFKAGHYLSKLAAGAVRALPGESFSGR